MVSAFIPISNSRRESKCLEDAKEHNDQVFPPGQTLHIALAAQGFAAYLLDFGLVQQLYDLTIDRLSGKICTFAHFTSVDFATNKVTKEAEILQEGFSLIFLPCKTFYRTAII